MRLFDVLTHLARGLLFCPARAVPALYCSALPLAISNDPDVLRSLRDRPLVFALRFAFAQISHASVRYRTEGFRALGWRTRAGSERNVCDHQVAAAHRRGAPLSRHEHGRRATARVAGITAAIGASEAHAPAVKRDRDHPAERNGGPRQRKHAAVEWAPTARSRPSSDVVNPTSQEKGGARGTAKFREETSKKAETGLVTELLRRKR